MIGKVQSTAIVIFMLIGTALSYGQDKPVQNELLSYEAQDAATKYEIGLSEALGRLEKKFDISFIYKTGLLDGIYVPLDDELSDNLALELEKHLGPANLTYSRLNNRTFAISVDLSRYTEPFTEIIQQQVSGRVFDEDSGEALPGVNVLIVGTDTGTATDVDGNFELTVTALDDTLRFSYIGYQTQNVPLEGRTELEIYLMREAIMGEELVVTGIGQERRRKDLTGSISTVDAEAIEQVGLTSPQFALQGNVPGVRLAQTSGDANDAPQIFVRGIGTWNGDSQPLYVIDGQIFEPPRDENEDVIGAWTLNTPPNLFNMINPNDIESISVLKDASAAAIYGSRGGNGVVLITSKSGQQGRPRINVNTRTWVQNIPKFDMLNTQQYVDLTREMYTNSTNPDLNINEDLYGRHESDVNRLVNYNPQFDPESPYYISDRTTYDWQDNTDLVRNNALNHSTNINMSGAGEGFDYYLSAGLRDQEGIELGRGITRYTGSINVNADVTDWLKTGVKYKYANQESQTMGDDQQRLVRFVNAAPWQPLFDPNNEFGFAQVIDPYRFGEEWQQIQIYGQGASSNPLADNFFSAGHSKIDFRRNTIQTYVQVEPIEGLLLRGSLNLDVSKQDRNALGINAGGQAAVFSPGGNDPAEVNPDVPNSKGGMGHRINNIYNFQSDFTATYNLLLAEKHDMSITATAQDQRHRREFINFSSPNITSIAGIPEYTGYEGDIGNNNSIYRWDHRFWFGIAGRASYNYDTTYYLDLSYRRDASNGFDNDYQWGNFYSISGAWRISSESFFDVSFIDDLKIRGGWGEAGNDQAAVGSYAFLSSTTDASSYRFGYGGGEGLGNPNLGVIIDDFPNPELTWEVATTTTVGLDALLFNNKLDIILELYNRNTNGILQTVALNPSVGVNDPLFNVGEMENRGIDLNVSYNNQVGDFSYNISGNIGFLQNEVTKLYEGEPLFISGLFEREDEAYVEEGRSAGVIWGYKVGGIFQSQQEIDEYFSQYSDFNVLNVNQVEPGDMYFQDVHGNPTEEEPFYSSTPDGVINQYDRTEIGNTIPGYTYGINLNFGWKNFDLLMNFYGEGDVDKYNSVKQSLEDMSSAGPNYSASTLNRWTPSNTDTDVPRAVIDDPAGNNRFSDRWVESAAFFRLNNWRFGYSLPVSVLEKFNNVVRSLRVYVGGQNNIYRHSWSGIDPVNDRNPLPRTYSFGIDIQF